VWNDTSELEEEAMLDEMQAQWLVEVAEGCAHAHVGLALLGAFGGRLSTDMLVGILGYVFGGNDDHLMSCVSTERIATVGPVALLMTAPSASEHTHTVLQADGGADGDAHGNDGQNFPAPSWQNMLRKGMTMVTNDAEKAATIQAKITAIEVEIAANDYSRAADLPALQLMAMELQKAVELELQKAVELQNAFELQNAKNATTAATTATKNASEVQTAKGAGAGGSHAPVGEPRDTSMQVQQQPGPRVALVSHALALGATRMTECRYSGRFDPDGDLTSPWWIAKLIAVSEPENEGGCKWLHGYCRFMEQRHRLNPTRTPIPTSGE
jgi:hypothetical protein